jgi:hypothetical protein
MESEGFAEKYRAVVEGAIRRTNRSAKGGARSSLHYGGEGVLIHPPHQDAVKLLIKQRFGIEMPIRTVGEYLKRWGSDPAETGQARL